MAEKVYETWQRLTGLPWSEARKRGYTTGTAAANIALQRRLLSGWRPEGVITPTAPAPAAPAAPDYGYYTPIIQNLQQQLQTLPSTYQPQIEALKATIPTIQQQYQSLLEQLRQRTTQQQQQLQEEQTRTVGTEQVRAAAAGVAPAYGTPEMAAIQQIQTGYQRSIADLLSKAAEQERQIQLAGTQAEQSIQAQIAQILAQQEQARQQLLAQIAQTQAEALAAAEERRRWETEMAASLASTAASARERAASKQADLSYKEQQARLQRFQKLADTYRSLLAKAKNEREAARYWVQGVNAIKTEFPELSDQEIWQILGYPGGFRSYQTFSFPAPATTPPPAKSSTTFGDWWSKITSGIKSRFKKVFASF
jgi:hypothetical protein